MTEVGNVHAGTLGNKLLVIENDDAIRESLKQFLLGKGYTVTAANKGQEALNHLRHGRSPTDLILLKLVMPGMDGYEFRQKQKLDSALASIPVIVLAAPDDPPELALLLGDVGYIQNPLDGDMLLAAIHRFTIKQKPVVLVVDDVMAIGIMLDLTLSQDGFAVRLATTGKEAVEIYRKHHDEIALVLMDVQMPGMDGPATLATLQKMNPELKCCFMSGSTGKYTSQELLDMGAAHVMMKPFVSLNILTRFLWDMIG